MATTIIPTLSELLNQNPHLKLSENNKIVCHLTNHEMPARADVVFAYIRGSKYKKSLEWYSHNYSQYLPYIVENKKNSKQLYCTITQTTLNKIPEEVNKHVNGKKFKRLKEELSKKTVPKNEDEILVIIEFFFLKMVDIKSCTDGVRNRE
mmetsp:Transcript_13339/g.20004  ORF Transcript_13339/g.20004 Transcript_13339/m.20004 type:complete len:150 (+) Transcript_13339:14-463(+)